MFLERFIYAIVPDRHSVRRLLTGLAIAAFTAWKLMVIIAIMMEARATKTNVSQLMETRYSKSCNHLFMMYQLTGIAIVIAIKTRRTNSLASILVIPRTLAPSTFRMPISFF